MEKTTSSPPATTQFVVSDDLASTLKNREGRFLAVLPGGDALVADSQFGHSITTLRVISKPDRGFSIAKVADLKSSSSPDYAENRDRQSEDIPMLPVAG